MSLHALFDQCLRRDRWLIPLVWFCAVSCLALIHALLFGLFHYDLLLVLVILDNPFSLLFFFIYFWVFVRRCFPKMTPDLSELVKNLLLRGSAEHIGIFAYVVVRYPYPHTVGNTYSDAFKKEFLFNWAFSGHLQIVSLYNRLLVLLKSLDEEQYWSLSPLEQMYLFRLFKRHSAYAFSNVEHSNLSVPTETITQFDIPVMDAFFDLLLEVKDTRYEKLLRHMAELSFYADVNVQVRSRKVLEAWELQQKHIEG